MTKLQNKIAIVTGASRPGGIGTAICRALANDGANVFFTHLYDYDKEFYPQDADEHWPDSFAGELRQLGVQASHMKLDLAISGSASYLLEEVRKRMGLPTILVNNATYSVDADFRQLTESIIDAHCAVNMRGPSCYPPNSPAC